MMVTKHITVEQALKFMWTSMISSTGTVINGLDLSTCDMWGIKSHVMESNFCCATLKYSADRDFEAFHICI